MKIFDRQKNVYFEEKVYGDFWLRLAYENPTVRRLMSSFPVQKSLSKAFGLSKNSHASRLKVADFVKQFEISLDDFVVPQNGYQSFNDFFIRAYREGLRVFPRATEELGAPAEGRLSIFPVENGKLTLSIKGESFHWQDFVPPPLEAPRALERGFAFVFRLCPVDYHRFHFPDEGRVIRRLKVPGKLHSVHPIAQKKIPKLFCENFRELSLFESKNFSTLVLAEVGAMNVGTIVQSFDASEPVKRGQEKGYFAFGGSTVVMLVEAQAVIPRADIIKKNAEGFEVYVRLGECIAQGR